jgi:hypothetical protein
MNLAGYFSLLCFGQIKKLLRVQQQEIKGDEQFFSYDQKMSFTGQIAG